MIPGTTELRYRPDIDGLRAVAVLAVVLHHVWPTRVSGGFVGVDVFFVISGYLITGIIARQIKAGEFSFAAFYRRRARRLLPALLAMLLVVMAAGWFILLPSDYLSTARAALGTLLLGSNFIFWKMLALGYFAPDAKLNPLLHTWSLGVEEQFYLAFPLFLLLIGRFRPSFRMGAIVAIMVASMAASVWFIGAHQVAVFFLAPFRAWEFLAGAMLATRMFPVIGSGILRSLVVAAGLTAILLATVIYTPATAFPGWAALLPVAGSMAVIHGGTASSPSTFRTGLLATRPIVYVGRISYSLYLWHWPLITLASYLFQFEAGLWSGAGLIAASLLVASLSYHFIEVPFRVPGRLERRHVVQFGACATLLIGCISIAGIATAGFESRVSGQARIFDRERHPVIPFRPCEDRSTWCVLGDPHARPEYVFWGDSHMLAWAPAIDRELRAVGRSGYLAAHSSCPPAMGVASAGSAACIAENRRVLERLQRHREVRRVILAANWGAYLEPGRIAPTDPSVRPTRPQALLAKAVGQAMDALDTLGVTVAIIGPVPTYAHDVPFELARAHERLGLSYPLSKPLVGLFSPELRAIAAKHGSTYVDVASAMCSSNRCETSRAGHSNYRDEGHLSVSGALAYRSLVRDAMQVDGEMDEAR